MQDIIAPIPKELIKEELTKEKFLRKTNKGENELYVVSAANAPNIIQEIGRLREVSFRAGGGGTGLALDLDEYDVQEPHYKQLLVWDPEAEQIIGGYRYICCKNAMLKNYMHLSTTHYFDFKEEFVANYLPKTIELGRSFIQPEYQNKDGNRKGLFSLDNLWDGLGALVVEHPDVEYFFGKVTIYEDYNEQARSTIVTFMNHYFPDPKKLVTSKPHLLKEITTDTTAFANKLQGLSYKEGHIQLTHTVKELGEFVPPLVNSYMNLSPTMLAFDTAINQDFGDVYETGILIKINDIYESKKERHITTYAPNPAFNEK